MKEIKDYYTKEEADVTFKKLKVDFRVYIKVDAFHSYSINIYLLHYSVYPIQKKKKARKKAEEQEPVEENSGINVTEDNGKLAPMEEDDKEPASTTAEAGFVDDDDLQQALARTRRIANKKKKSTVEISMEYIGRSGRSKVYSKCEYWS